MRNFILLFIGALWTLSSCAQQNSDTVKGTQETSQKITEKVKAGKANLVDVRTPEEYNAGHLQYSKNMDIKSGNFNEQISKLDKKKPVYLYCRSGNRSGKAADSLHSLGFKVYYNIGGFEDLKLAGFKAE